MYKCLRVRAREGISKVRSGDIISDDIVQVVSGVGVGKHPRSTEGWTVWRELSTREDVSDRVEQGKAECRRVSSTRQGILYGENFRRLKCD